MLPRPSEGSTSCSAHCELAVGLGGHLRPDVPQRRLIALASLDPALTHKALEGTLLCHPIDLSTLTARPTRLVETHRVEEIDDDPDENSAHLRPTNSVSRRETRWGGAAGTARNT